MRIDLFLPNHCVHFFLIFKMGNYHTVFLLFLEEKEKDKTLPS